jgi:hypothetical protein
MIKLFEEYRLFKGPTDWGIGDVDKDPNEPFFVGKKKKEYKRVKRQAEIDARNIDYRVRQDNTNREEFEKFQNQKPMIEKYIEMMKNSDETVLKSAFRRQDAYMTYAIMLNDKTKIFAKFKFDNRNASYSLSVNKNKISLYKEPVKNESDPYGEENWNENVKPPAEILADTIREYVEENELII